MSILEFVTGPKNNRRTKQSLKQEGGGKTKTEINKCVNRSSLLGASPSPDPDPTLYISTHILPVRMSLFRMPSFYSYQPGNFLGHPLCPLTLLSSPGEPWGGRGLVGGSRRLAVPSFYSICILRPQAAHSLPSSLSQASASSRLFFLLLCSPHTYTHLLLFYYVQTGFTAELNLSKGESQQSGLAVH